MKTTQLEPGENDWRAGEACSQNHAANEEISSRSCHWHSSRRKRNSNSAVTNELSGQRGRPLQYSPSERAACQVARACSENPALLTHTMHHHISPISPPSPTHSPRLQAHARSHAPCPLSCAAAGARAGSGPPRERACDAHRHHDRTTRLPVHARHIGVGCGGRACAHTKRRSPTWGRRRRQGFC
jgi:hypothetical protein